MQTTTSTSVKEIRRSWHIIDMQGKILGRTTTKVSKLLMGKSKPYYVPYLDCGDYVVVINAVGVVVTGKKESQKTYDAYSGYPGGRKEKTFAQVKKENPTKIIIEAVSGMLPKNKLRASMLKRLYVFAGPEHDYKDKFTKN